MWIFGRYAYMYFELSGDEIRDNAVVAMNAHIMNIDYWLRGNEASRNTTSDIDFESAECVIKFREDKNYAGKNDRIVRSRGGTWGDYPDFKERPRFKSTNDVW